MTNKEAIEILKNYHNGYFGYKIDDVHEAHNLAIKALEKDKCSSCKHYDKDYGETCLNPSGTCRVFYYERYEGKEND